MNPFIEANLALVLFLPWFVILGVLFWVYPRQPRDGRRRLFDATSLVVAVIGGVEVHRRMPISLTFDHRACTGGEAARFLKALLDDLAAAD